MAGTITRDVLESYLRCPSKAHLKLTGQEGTRSDYEGLLIESRRRVRLAAMDRNDHCQACEYRQRCRDRAVQEDNLSLLRGMGEKEVREHHRKGIFTVTQLSCTFRPRRRSRRARAKAGARPYQFPLKALA